MDKKVSYKKSEILEILKDLMEVKQYFDQIRSKSIRKLGRHGVYTSRSRT